MPSPPAGSPRRDELTPELIDALERLAEEIGRVLGAALAKEAPERPGPADGPAPSGRTAPPA